MCPDDDCLTTIFPKLENACESSKFNVSRKFGELLPNREKTRKLLIRPHFTRLCHKTPTRCFYPAKLNIDKTPRELGFFTKYMGSFLIALLCLYSAFCRYIRFIGLNLW